MPDDAFTLLPEAEILPGERQSQENNFGLRRNMLRSGQNTPQQHIQDRELSGNTGLPPSVVETQRDQLQQRFRDREIEDNLQFAPATRDFLNRDPNALGIVRDNIPDLVDLETSLGTAAAGNARNTLAQILQLYGAARGGQPDPLSRSVVEGFVSDFAGLTLRGFGAVAKIQERQRQRYAATALRILGADDFAQTIEDFTPPWWLSKAEQLDFAGRQLQNFGRLVGPEEQDKNFATDVAGGVGQVGGQITAMLLSGGSSIIASALLGAQGAGIIQEQIEETPEITRDNPFGLPQEVTEDLAILGGGLITGLTERYGIDILINKLPTRVKASVLRMIFSGGTEAAQEIVEGIGHNLISLGLYDPERKVLNIEQLTGEGGVAFAVGATVSALIPGRGRIHSGPAAQAQSMDRVNEQATQAQETIQSDDVAVLHRQEIVRNAGIAQVRIPAVEVWDYASSAPEGQQSVLDKLGVSDQMVDALAEGIDVVVSGDAYAQHILGAPAYEALSPHIRYDQASLTASEAVQRVQENAPEVLEQLQAEEQALEQQEFTPEVDDTLSRNRRTQALVQQFMQTGQIDLVETLAKAPRDISTALDELVDEIETRKRDIGGEIAAARINELDQQLAVIDERLNTLNAEIELAETEGGPQGRLRQQFDSLIEQSIRLQEEQQAIEDSEAARLLVGEAEDQVQAAQEAGDVSSLEIADQNLQTAQELQQQADEVLAGREPVVTKPSQEVRTKAKALQDLNVRTTRESVRAARRGFTEGRKVAKENIKAAQDAFRAVVNNAFPKPSNVKGRVDTNIAKQLQKKRADFLDHISKITSLEQLERRLPKLQSDLLAELDKERKRELQRELGRVLSKKVVFRDRSNILRGRLGPEVTRLMQSLQKAIKTSKKDAALALEQIRGGAIDIPETEANLVSRVLAVKAEPEAVSATDLENLLIDIDDLTTEGRRITRQNALLRVARVEEVREDLVNAIGEVPEKGPLAKETTLRRLAVGSGLGWSGAWWNKIGTIMRTSDRALADKVQETLSLFEESRAHEENRKARIEQFFSIFARELGLDSNEKGLRQRFFGGTKAQRHIIRSMQQGALEKISIANGKDFVHSDGSVKKLNFTRNELIQHVAMLQNDAVREDAMKETSDAYTEEIIEALEAEVNDDPYSRAAVRASTEFYDKYFPDIDKAYTDYYGVHMPRIDRYIPVRRHGGDPELSEFLKQAPLLGKTPSSLKERQRNSGRPLQKSDWVNVLQQHVSEIEYFIAYGEKARLINHVFDAKTMQRIEEIHGPTMQRIIRADIDWFTRKAVVTNIINEKALTAFVRNFGISQLAIKPQIALKQLASFPAFAEDVTVFNFMRGMAAFGKNPRAAIRFLNRYSRFYKNRTISLDHDFEDATSSLIGSRLLNFTGRNPDVTNTIMLNVRFGDKGAIGIGMYGHVWAKLKEKGISIDKATPAQIRAAFQAADRIASRTQQSKDPDQISVVQRGNVFFRVLAQFMSSANALTRAEYSAIIEASRGRISKKEFAKRFVIYHIMIPNMIMWIANAFQWEPEDQIYASILGQLTGLLILGDLIDFTYRKIWDLAIEDEDLELTAFEPEARHPLQLAVDLGNAADALARDGFEFDDFMEGNRAIESALKFGGALTSVPMATLYNQMRGIALMEEEPKEGAALALGWSPYVVKEKIMD